MDFFEGAVVFIGALIVGTIVGFVMGIAQAAVIVLLLNWIGIPTLAALTFWQVFGFVLVFDTLMIGHTVMALKD